MKKPNLLLIILVIILLIGVSCNNQQNNYTYKWPLIGEPFDSLMNRLEWQFNDFAPFDSIHNTIFLLDSTTKSLTDEKKQVATSRVLYWQARFLRRQQQYDSALCILKKSLLLNDSIKYYYDMLRIKTEWYSNNDLADGAELYRHLEQVNKFTKEIGDRAYEAQNALQMGNLLGNIGEYEKGLYYLALSDSLYSYCGFNKIPIKNKINVARLLGDSGHKNHAVSILKTLLKNPALKGDTFAINTVSRNLWAFTNDKRYLFQAYNEIKDLPNYRHLRGFYRSLLANQYYREENYDSCIYYADMSMEDLSYVNEYGHKANIWYNLGLSWMIKDCIDSALACRIIYEDYTDSLSMTQRTTEVLRLSALHEMDIKEAEYTASIQRRNILIVFAVVLIIGGAIIIWLLINRRNMRHKMATMKNELELEKAKRKIAATTLTIEKKDNMLTAIRSELSEMRQEGEIKEGSVRKLESTIKSHLLENDNEETFREMFDVVNPLFTERLRERCPDLTENHIRLACYMLMEFDSKRIAALLMIKPQSVRQARWRLSQKLNVPENETLESFLRSLNDTL